MVVDGLPSLAINFNAGFRRFAWQTNKQTAAFVHWTLLFQSLHQLTLHKTVRVIGGAYARLLFILHSSFFFSTISVLSSIFFMVYISYSLFLYPPLSLLSSHFTLTFNSFGQMSNCRTSIARTKLLRVSLKSSGLLKPNNFSSLLLKSHLRTCSEITQISLNYLKIY